MAKDYSQYNGKKVVVIRNLAEANEKGETAVEVEGTIQAANARGGLLKPKGKSSYELIEMKEIEDVRLVETSVKPIKRKKLKPVEIGGARNHLAERHGYSLSEVNEMTEEDALTEHESIDHEASDIGHVHVEKSDEQTAATDDDAAA